MVSREEMIFNFALECIIRKVHENVGELKLHGTCQPMLYADINVLEVNINTTKRKSETLAEATKNIELTYTWWTLITRACRVPKFRKNHNIKIIN
jgi:hypothetical protein